MVLRRDAEHNGLPRHGSVTYPGCQECVCAPTGSSESCLQEDTPGGSTQNWALSGQSGTVTVKLCGGSHEFHASPRGFVSTAVSTWSVAICLSRGTLSTDITQSRRQGEANVSLSYRHEHRRAVILLPEYRVLLQSSCHTVIVVPD